MLLKAAPAAPAPTNDMGAWAVDEASGAAGNYWPPTDVNKRVHCVRAGQFKTTPRYTRDDCKLGG